MSENEFIKDVDYEEVSNSEEKNKEKNIRGKILYYSTAQVATLLGEKDSKIRYYTKFFEDILNIETSNIQKQYTEEDINKLRYIIELKNEGMTLKQIKEFCQDVDFNEGKAVVKESNPLSIKALAQALMEEQTKQIELMKQDILSELKGFIEQQSSIQEVALDKIKEDICVSVDDSVSEKLNNTIEELKDTFKTGYVTKEQIKEYENRKSWFGRFFK